MEYFMWLPAITVIESFLRIFAYITIIFIGFKMVKALNNYNDKNSKQFIQFATSDYENRDIAISSVL